MAEFEVSGSVLEWARAIRGITTVEAANRLGITEGELRRLESGPQRLPGSFLRRISDEYGVAYGALFMPEPLPAPPKPKQYRTFMGLRPALSEATHVVLETVNEAIDDLTEIRDSAPDLIPTHTLPTIARSGDVEELAARERARLGVNIKNQFAQSEAAARDAWRSAVEASGVFVYFEKMPRTDCLGFSILDARRIPVICVNDSADISSPSKLFTILHEHCHLLLRLPGISDQEMGNAVEKFCNRFAAAVLVPRERLRQVMPGGGPHQDWSDSELQMVANKFKVTMSVLALRLEHTGLAGPGFYARKVALWNAQGRLSHLSVRDDKPFTSFPDRVLRRLGHHHTSTVLKALRSGAINVIEARGMVGAGPKHFAALRSAVQ
jgi:Zn-dependent peptidase ImmA (M78 family)/transcriptional regulator with XRE-family HTH domain